MKLSQDQKNMLKRMQVLYLDLLPILTKAAVKKIPPAKQDERITLLEASAEFQTFKALVTGRPDSYWTDREGGRPALLDARKKAEKELRDLVKTMFFTKETPADEAPSV